jgi:hypothetical protein
MKTACQRAMDMVSDQIELKDVTLSAEDLAPWVVPVDELAKHLASGEVNMLFIESLGSYAFKAQCAWRLKQFRAQAVSMEQQLQAFLRGQNVPESQIEHLISRCMTGLFDPLPDGQTMFGRIDEKAQACADALSPDDRMAAMSLRRQISDAVYLGIWKKIEKLGESISELLEEQLQAFEQDPYLVDRIAQIEVASASVADTIQKELDAMLAVFKDRVPAEARHQMRPLLSHAIDAYLSTLDPASQMVARTEHLKGMLMMCLSLDELETVLKKLS